MFSTTNPIIAPLHNRHNNPSLNHSTTTSRSVPHQQTNNLQRPQENNTTHTTQHQNILTGSLFRDKGTQTDMPINLLSLHKEQK